ncbi:MAG: RIP metalloprotease RseP [Lachnospiraceae bacterium]|nr:RIP metalloprotease RseP [Lachnospiraceae bacterium]
MKIIIALLIFSAIILFHELGHFLLAKMNGIVVTEFSLGMGPRLLSFEKGGTRYSWKLLPFGGSCMMLGEDGSEDTEGAFNTKRPDQRIAVIAAGPIFNFILAFAASVVIISVVGYDPAEILQVEEESPAAEAGLEVGDQIIRFQGKNVDISRDVSTYMNLTGVAPGEEVQMTVLRDGKKEELSFTPATYERYILGFTGVYDQDRVQITNLVENYPMSQSKVCEGDYLTSINGYYFKSYEDWSNYLAEHPMTEEPVTITYERDGLGYEETLIPKATTSMTMGFGYNVGRVKTTAMGVLKYSFIEIKYWIKTTLQSLKLLITGQFGLKDMSGPVGVVDIIGDTYEQAKSEGILMVVLNMLNLVVLLSANLGVMNLLPIPALDGGRLVFLIIEAVRGKAIDREKEGMVHFVGLMLLMLLMIVVMFNDIQKLF